MQSKLGITGGNKSGILKFSVFEPLRGPSTAIPDYVYVSSKASNRSGQTSKPGAKTIE
ncbi:MAG: hypothetical protein JKX81_18480 [Arenicella sp.]|nr:hypothetical protein [Arenicella sp.]